MNVETSAINTPNIPDIKVQPDLQATSGPDVSVAANNTSNEGNALQDDLVTVTSTSNGKAAKPASGQAGTTSASAPAVLSGTKGVITLDEDKNVVIRFFDNDGKIVRQYPPEDYLLMMKELNQVAESLFHKTA